VDDLLPPDLRSIFAAAAEHAPSPINTPTIAQFLSVTRKTVLNRTRRNRWPPPSELIVWCRLAVYAHLLEATSWPAERIALDLEFPSLAAASNIVSRYTGHRPRRLRGAGSLDHVIECFRRRVLTFSGDRDASRHDPMKLSRDASELK
jgi:AraC-like DNA-binding protein